jgi:methionyl aminopeptidase
MSQPQVPPQSEEQAEDEDCESGEPYEDFGTYSILLPPEPFVFGTNHLKPYREVPAHIPRPPYALRKDGMPESSANAGLGSASGKIKLGGATERRVREAAVLARRVREFAGTQVKVSD